MSTTATGIRILVSRKKKNLTQEQLAQKVGSTASMISRIENGKIPRADLLQRIASELDISLDYLMSEEQENEPWNWLPKPKINKQGDGIPDEKNSRY